MRHDFFRAFDGTLPGNFPAVARMLPGHFSGLTAGQTSAMLQAIRWTSRRMVAANQLAADAANDMALDVPTKLASCVASSATPDVAFGLASHVALIRMVWRNFRAAMSGAEKLNLLRGNACPAKKMTIGGCADA
jgi:hypothetical protein